MQIVVVMVAVSLGVAIWATVAAGDRKRRQTMLRQVARYLGGRHDATAAFGNHGGTVVRFQLTTRGAGKSKEWWTELEVVVPAAYPLAIHVRRRRWLDHTRMTRSDVVDLPLGDEPFDEAFVVEAAPEDIARKLLDAGVRSFLSALQRPELDTVAIGESKLLRLAVQGGFDDLAGATAAIDSLVGIAARVRGVYAVVDGAVPAQPGGSPYRPQPAVVAPGREVPAVRAVEVAALEAARASRARRYRVAVVVAVIALPIIALACLWLG